MTAARIVTSTYRYKRPKRTKPQAITGGPAVVTPRKRALLPTDGTKLQPPPPANDDGPEPDTSPRGKKSAIVTVKRRRNRFGDAPDLTPEEHRQRGDAADALFREIVRRATDRD